MFTVPKMFMKSRVKKKKKTFFKLTENYASTEQQMKSLQRK